MSKTRESGRKNHLEFAIKPGMQRGFTSASPIPTRLVSNEEYNPLPQTPGQIEVERRIGAISERAARRLGLDRRRFLRTTGGMAASLLALNQTFGRFFDVFDVEVAEAAAFAEGRGPEYFVIDVQTHYVGASYDPQGAESRTRCWSARGL